MASKKKKKQNKVVSWIGLILAVIVGVYWFINLPNTEQQGGEQSETTPLAEGSSFAIHFIDVGQADAILVLCDGKSMLVDGGNAGDSSTVYSYMKNMNITHLDYIVCTHAHEDHVGGLPGALNAVETVGVAYCPVTEGTTKVFNNFLSALEKKNIAVTVPTLGDTFTLGSAVVTVVGPAAENPDVNNTSIVLRIVYGETSYLLMGDAETVSETAMLTKGYTLKSDVLKIGHHGSDTSTGYAFLREVLPTYAVISVGTDNKYGHPNSDTLSRLKDAGTVLYRTDLQGTVICQSDGKTITFTVDKNPDADVFGNAGDK